MRIYILVFEYLHSSQPMNHHSIPPRLGGGVGENSLSLGELLAYIRDQATSVAQGELVGHVVVDEVVITLNLVSSPRQKDVARWGATPDFGETKSPPPF